MKRFQSDSKSLMQFTALLLSAFLVACGSGGGGGGAPAPSSSTTAAATATPTPIIPGATCTAAAGATVPTVTSSNPVSGDLLVTTSTTGAAGGSKLITAAFSLAMNPTTLNSGAPGTLL